MSRTHYMRNLSIEGREDRIIAYALRILHSRLNEGGVFTGSNTVKDYLRLRSQGFAHEVFGVMHLDSQHRLIEYEQLFRGTLNQTAVYVREVMKQALLNNSAALILHHNHPSGCCRPSCADAALTHELKTILAHVEVEVLDHVITSDAGVFSMAEAGLL